MNRCVFVSFVFLFMLSNKSLLARLLKHEIQVYLFSCYCKDMSYACARFIFLLHFATIISVFQIMSQCAVQTLRSQYAYTIINE